jgi:hypothetical protein
MEDINAMLLLPFKIFLLGQDVSRSQLRMEWPPTQEYINYILDRLGQDTVEKYLSAGRYEYTAWQDLPVRRRLVFPDPPE